MNDTFTPLLRVSQLTKFYGERPGCREVSFVASSKSVNVLISFGLPGMDRALWGVRYGVPGNASPELQLTMHYR